MSRKSALGRTFDAANDAISIDPFRTTQLFDNRLHALHRMRRQQLQDTQVLTHAGASTVPFFQTFPQLQKYSRKLAVAVHVRTVQCCGASLQSRQIMQQVKYLIDEPPASEKRRLLKYFTIERIRGERRADARIPRAF